MRNSKNIRRKGFTLVELLIVIVVIGILSAMMMLSSTEATTSAKAAAIVSNLRNIKTAALAFYADNQSETDLDSSDVVKYLKDGGGDLGTGYDAKNATSGDWYALYDISKEGTATEQAKIKQKLQDRAAQTGLTTNTTQAVYDGNDNVVGMYIR
ncbi:MAG: type II secretion system protein [Synergistaceae bacterium]|nr:type II secretion system protein [Synergistaceae bacterium]